MAFHFFRKKEVQIVKLELEEIVHARDKFHHNLCAVMQPALSNSCVG
jgi:hypothetical protein